MTDREISPDATNGEAGGSEAKKEKSVEQFGCSSSSCYRLFDRQRTIHQIIGGGRAADVILWKCWRVSIFVVAVATAAWLLFERSELSFLTICSDVLLILVVFQFVRANGADVLNKQLQPLPELVLSEEMVTSAAASFRAKINSILLMAHDITLGKDFRLFFKVVVFLWLLSVAGSFCTFFTLAYIDALDPFNIDPAAAGLDLVVVVVCSIHLIQSVIIGTILSVTLPALYNKYENHVDEYAGLVHQKFSKHYKVVDENVIRRIPRRFSKSKDD